MYNGYFNFKKQIFLKIIFNLLRFHDAGSVKRFMYCMKFTLSNQENHEVLFQEIFEKRKNGGAAELLTQIRNIRKTILPAQLPSTVSRCMCTHNPFPS